MTSEKQSVARACLEAADTGAMTFPEIVGTLIKGGFDGYAVDFRRAAATYYLADGTAFELEMHRITTPVAVTFDDAAITAAIGEAQQQVPGYTYRGFCEKAAAAGCAGYLVSFPGRRALYVGRTGETHVELFPN